MPRPPGPLRILQVILSRGFAGSERAVAETCNALCSDHEVRLIVRRDHRDRDGASVRDELDPRVQVVTVPRWWRTGRVIRREIASWRPDVVHTHLRRGTRLVAASRQPAPHLCTLHIGLNGPRFLDAHGIVCISEWQLATIPRGYAGRRYLIYNSLVPEPRLPPERIRRLREELGAGEGDVLVGGAGRLVPGKGFDVLVRAFRAAAVPRSKLAIIGHGRELGRLRRLAGSDVRVTGFRRDAKQCLQALDVFVCPSIREPFGRVIIEALDAGTQVIAADVPGPRDIARRLPLRLFPAGDAAALATALRGIERPTHRARPDLSAFAVDAIKARVESAYAEIIADRSAVATGISATEPADVAGS